jgi:hypothetical protein
LIHYEGRNFVPGVLMRVYLPSTLPALARLLGAGTGEAAGPGPAIGPAPLHGYAVTPALREWYSSGDLEELEYVAMAHAARASLRLLLDEPDAPPRRVVLAAELPDGQVAQAGAHPEPALVVISTEVPLRLVASGHVDDPEATEDIRAAVAALPKSDEGDDDAQFTVDGAQGHELMWFATQELKYLLD